LVLAPETTLRLAGGIHEVTGPGRLLARLFGLREMVLGGVVLERLRYGLPEAPLLYLNAACDAGDATLIAGALGSRHKLGRLRLGLPIAVGVAAAWAWMARTVTK